MTNPYRLKNSKSIVKYILDNEGRCGSIRCAICPLRDKDSSTCFSPTKRYEKAIRLSIELKIISETEAFEILL